MYVDMICFGPDTPDDEPLVSLEKLQETIPSFDWVKGRSGVLLPDEVAIALNEMS